MEKVTMIGECNCCEREVRIEVPFEGFLKYQAGELIQNCFPNLTPSQREFFITGFCEKCQDNLFSIFADEDNDDDEDDDYYVD